MAHGLVLLWGMFTPILVLCTFFYARQLYGRQVLLRTRILAMAILSVRPSVRLSRPGTDSRPGEIETPGLHHMIDQSVWFLMR